MKRRSFLLGGIAAIAGAAVGAMLRGRRASAEAGQRQAQPNNLRNVFLDRLAGALGVQRPALDTAIKTAAEATADEAVRQGKLTREQADRLRERIERGVLEGGQGGQGQRAAFRKHLFESMAQALNITPQQLRDEFRAGKTLAEIAQAHGTTEQAVRESVLQAARAMLEQDVTNGKLAQAQADAIYARLQQSGLQQFGGKPGKQGKRLRGRDRHRVPSQPAASGSSAP